MKKITEEELNKKLHGAIELLEASFALKDYLPVMMKISDEDAFMSLISGLTFTWCQTHGKGTEPEHAQMHLDIAKMIIDMAEAEKEDK